MTVNNQLRLIFLGSLGVAMLLVLAGCAHNEVPVIKEVPVEVKVAVSAPCVVNNPDRVIALRETIGRAQWDRLGTDQREKFIAAQALERKVYGDKKDVATAGCKATDSAKPSGAHHSH